jgi:redox-sensitive bicupin YhaK (pirin superfamily)
LPKADTEVNRTLYFYEGDRIQIDQNEIAPDHGIRLEAQKEITVTAGVESVHLLLLQGRPIDEPVAQQGPFVMNTEGEIQKAMQEYRLTQFGGWPWPHPDNVHPKEKGRFAKYPDGELVEK